MKRSWSSAALALMASATMAGCGADYGGYEPQADDEAELELGSTTQAVSACVGDDANYDFNAFAGALAVAIANELGRWDVNADFTVVNGKLELSTTGNLRCGTGCSNIKAILRLQDDVSSTVPNHSPSLFRQKLSSWYQTQTQKLTTLVDTMLRMDKGVYRLKAKNSGKYIAVDGSSTSDGALIEQQSSVSHAGADQWRVTTVGKTHKFVNVRSGKCLSLSSESSSNGVSTVQKTCATSTLQEFELSQTGDAYALRTKFTGMALEVANGSTSNDARIQQYGWDGGATKQQFTFEPFGTGPHISPKFVPTAVYHLAFKHSEKALGVDGGSMNDGASIEQYTYTNDDRFHWYVTPSGDKQQLVNRRSGKCLALSAESATASITQKTCADVNTQQFVFNPSSGLQVIYAYTGKPIEVQGSSTANDARVVQAADGGWNLNRQLRLTPVIAGEPHRLKFSHITTEAACGDYYWYDIAQPNGKPLKKPADSFVQLIFAGGKQTLTGADVNPFIAQQVSGNKVAIDPTYGLNDGATTAAGTCSASCVRVSSASLAGQCCSCNGLRKAFSRSTWNASTYLCQ